jgi:NitT/TauT family transport system ATP-binding protein
MTILCFDNIHMAYGAQTILANFSLQVESGEAIGLIGPSGAGKSTLLRLACGLILPDQGKVICSARRLGYVFQEPRLLPWRTVLDNVALPLMARGTPRKQSREQGMKLLREMQLKQCAQSYPGTLSGGMKQRVSLARAFAVEPDLLLFDEPFTGLDPDLRTQLRDLTDKMLEQRKVALLHVTHDTQELPRATNRIVEIQPHP